MHYLCYLGHPDSVAAQLRVARVGPDGYLLTLDGQPLDLRYPLQYRQDLGLRVIKEKE